MEQAQKITEQVLQECSNLNMPVLPSVFHTFYEYFLGEQQELNHEIDALKEHKMLSLEKMHQLYEKYIMDVQKDARRNFIAILEKSIRLSSEFGSNTSSYSDNLNHAIEDMVSGNSDAVQTIVQKLVTETQSVIEKNKNLEAELSTARSQMIQMEKQVISVRKEALTDGLTGVANRRHFNQELPRLCFDAVENEMPISILMIDIDFFKKFNDNYGHLFGDQILKYVALTLQKNVKGGDFIARYGGEEFAIVVPNTTLQNATRLADNLRQAIARKEIVNKSTGDKLGHVTVSMGVAERRPDEDIDTWIGRADEALYAAKHGGRNQVSSAA